jgi:predicted SAM-dependent methyltransferase
MKLNLGSGPHPLRGWVNLDVHPWPGVDVVTEVPPLAYADNSVEEIYAGHFLEHLHREDGMVLLRECHRVLVPGGRLGVVVPDMRAVLTEYVSMGERELRWPERVYQFADLDHLCEVFIYGAKGPYGHQWCWEEATLERALGEAGFSRQHSIDRYRDGRLTAGVWWQCGIDAYKEEK